MQALAYCAFVTQRMHDGMRIVFLGAPGSGKGEGGPSGDTSTYDGCSVSAAKSASFGWIALSIVAMWLTRRRTAQ